MKQHMSNIEECIDTLLDEITRLKGRVQDQQRVIDIWTKQYEELMRENADLKSALALLEDIWGKKL